MILNKFLSLLLIGGGLKGTEQLAGRMYGFTMKGYLRTPFLNEQLAANLVLLREQLSDSFRCPPEQECICHTCP